MPVSDILEIPVLTENMAQKTLAVNMALQAMEKAISAVLEVNTDAGIGFADPFPIPFNDLTDLSPREALRCVYMKLMPGATAAFTLHHPENPHFFVCHNLTDHDARIRTPVAGMTGVVLPPGAVFLLLCDGEQITKMDFSLIALRQANDMRFNYYGNPPNGEVLGRILLNRDTTFPANMVGSVAEAGTKPLTDKTFTLYHGANPVGTVKILAAFGTSQFTTTGGVERTVTAGNFLELRNDTGYDSLIDNIEVVFAAYVTIPQPY